MIRQAPASTREAESPGAPEPRRSADQPRLEITRASHHPRCLLCGAENPLGLRLRFEVQEDGSVQAEFACDALYQSYPSTLHGGVTAALLDAAMTNALFAFGIVAVTAELTVRFVAPVSLAGVAVLRASLKSEDYPLFCVRATLEQDQHVKARASAKFMRKDPRDGG